MIKVNGDASGEVGDEQQHKPASAISAIRVSKDGESAGNEKIPADVYKPDQLTRFSVSVKLYRNLDVSI